MQRKFLYPAVSSYKHRSMWLYIVQKLRFPLVWNRH